MINFTVGPVQASEAVKAIGAENVPYFRTTEFSEIMYENERLIKKFANADSKSRVIFTTGSGTASMEAAIINLFNAKDKVLVVNGGSFGQRFVRMCQIHDIPYTEVLLGQGKALTSDILSAYDNQGYTGFLVNIHETSTGVYYDPRLISAFCKKNNILLVVDAISSFLADEFNMADLGVAAMITASQKALACPPGISIIVLSNSAIEKVNNMFVKSMYFDLKEALKNGERGQTPFTPAVGILLQIHERLREIDSNGGVLEEQRKIAALAENFRTGIKDLPLDIFSEALSNAITPLATRNCSAYEIFKVLKDEYHIWICPNGGELKDKVFRVGHIGSLTFKDNQKLIDALHDLVKRDILT